MNNNMTRFNSSYDKRTEVIENICIEKKMSIEQDISIKQQLSPRQQQQETRKQEHKLVTESATELGVHLMENELWNGVVNICKDDDARNIYLCTPVEGRLQLIKRYAAMV
jgi:hypothetical protein